jgi:quinol monooxygenase YgiN
MPYMRINHFKLKPGTRDEISSVAEDFLASNDPEESGLLYILDTFDDEGGPSIGVTVWSDKEKFEASGARWPEVMKAMEHLLDGPYSREEFELTVHNLPVST